MVLETLSEAIDDPISTTQDDKLHVDVCDICAADARVKILSRYSEGAPLMHHYCLDCADNPVAQVQETKTKDRSGIGTLLVCAGGLSAVLATCVDNLPGFAGMHPGYGQLQSLGILLGLLSLALGSILRFDLLAACGTVLTALTICADFVVLDRSPGLGWKQALVILASVCLVLFGRSIRAAARSASSQLRADHQPTTIPEV